MAKNKVAETATAQNNSAKFNEVFVEMLNKKLVIREGNTYSNFKEDKEPEVQESLKVLANFEVRPGETLPAAIICLGKFWNDRETFREVVKQIRTQAELAGKDPDEFLQVELRKDLDILSEVQKGISRVREALNYLRPRENKPAAKGKMVSISIDGKVYQVRENLKNALVEQYKNDKAKLKEELLKIAEVKDVEQF